MVAPVLIETPPVVQPSTVSSTVGSDLCARWPDASLVPVPAASGDFKQVMQLPMMAICVVVWIRFVNDECFFWDSFWVLVVVSNQRLANYSTSA